MLSVSWRVGVGGVHQVAWCIRTSGLTLFHVRSPQHLPRVITGGVTFRLLCTTPSISIDRRKSVIEIKKQFDAVFVEYVVHEVHSTKEKDRREFLRGTNIVLTPDKGKNLFNRYIGTFDPLAQAKEMLKAANEDDARQRALWALIRGMGGGKTRALEEIRLAMWTLPNVNVMCLAITFNSHMEYKHSKEGDLLDKGEKAFTLSVVLRLAVSLYNLNFKDIKRSDLQQQLLEIVSIGRSGDEIIQGFLLHALDRVQSAVKSQSEESGQPAVESDKQERWLVVVLVDEILRVITEFGKSTANPDIASVLREGVLDFEEDNGPAFSLMMSSLQPQPNWVTSSSRVVKGVPLCEELPSMDILVDWWFREALQAVDHHTRFRLVKMVAQTLNEDVPFESELKAKFANSSTELTQMKDTKPADGMADLENKLKSLVKFPSVVCQLPRGAEIVKQYLVAQWGEPFNDKFSTGLWGYLLDEMKFRYLFQDTKLNVEHVYAAVFGHSVMPRDPVVGALVERSVYVNSFEQLPNDFVPKSALAYLVATGAWGTDIVQLTPLRDLATNIMTSTNLEYGDALEQCLFVWLPIRLEVLVKLHPAIERELSKAEQRKDKLVDEGAPKYLVDQQIARVNHLESIALKKPSTPSLDFVFGAKDIFKTFSMKLSSVRKYTDRVQSSQQNSKEDNQTGLNNTNNTNNTSNTDNTNNFEQKVFRQLSKFDFYVSQGAVIVWQTATNDPFDMLVVFQDADDDKPRLLFLDCKAQLEDTNKAGPGLNARRNCSGKLMGVRELQRAAKSNKVARKSTVGRALAAGRYDFVGFTTHRDSDITSQTILPSDQGYDLKKPSLVMIGRDVAKNFFGPMWPVFDAVHTEAAVQKTFQDKAKRPQDEATRPPTKDAQKRQS